MKRLPLFGRVFALAVGVAAIGSTSAQAATPADTSMCQSAALTQPFAWAGDHHNYALVPGQDPGNFGGDGWALTGGAQIVTTTLADGTSASVLDLPSGAQAVSPTVCVTADYPMAKSMVRNVAGTDGAAFSVSYANATGWAAPKATGTLKGNAKAWTLSAPVGLQSNNGAGWQPVRFTLTGGGTSSDTQIYNLYVDPRMT